MLTLPARRGLLLAALALVTPSSLAADPPGDGLEMTPALARAGVTQADLDGPGVPPVDAYHPEGQQTPALGGRAIMHMASDPPNLNFLIENSAIIRWLHYDVHAGLLQFDPTTWEYELDTAASYDVEDTLILKGGAGEAWDNIVFGRIVEETDRHYVVESGSGFNPIERTEVPKADVLSAERETVWTFTLRDDVLWHDGHALDAHDVHFSWDMFNNPSVDCDEKRSTFLKIKRAEVLDQHTVRFFYEEQYFAAKGKFGLDLCILPSHLYNLSDPDNEDHVEDIDPYGVRQAEYINDNPHNIEWVGLGPYRVTTFERGQYVEAQKFAEHRFADDPERSGYLDTIRWRHINNDDSAWQALLNDELDVFYRIKTEDFVGEQTRDEDFTSKCYKVLTYVGNLGYTSWNLYRPHLSDVRVRKALAHAFDVADWVRTNYEGLALWSTNSQFFFGPAYNHEVKGLPYDLDEAEDLLADAGWYDRDGNGIIDKDGQDFVLEVLMPSGNKASEKFLQAMQDSYRKVGISVKITPYEWATFLEHILDRDFDACNLAWTLPTPESDPEQIWHSKNAGRDDRTSNHAGLADDEVDRLIELGQRELDDAKRSAIWKQLHARIYELQPYLFGWNVPRKIAINKNLHGLKLYKFEPGFRMQDLYYKEGTPGTRPLPR